MVGHSDKHFTVSPFDITCSAQKSPSRGATNDVKQKIIHRFTRGDVAPVADYPIGSG